MGHRSPRHHHHYTICNTITSLLWILVTLLSIATSSPTLTEGSMGAADYPDYQTGVRYDEYPVVVPKRTALLLDRIMVALQKAVEDEKGTRSFAPDLGENKMKSLVIDTDVGSDDAMAIILCVAAERKEQVRILGMTCVHGNTGLDNVCANTLKTLHTLRRLDIPVYRGASSSLVETFERAANIHGSDGFGDFEYPNAPQVEEYIQKEHAVNYLTHITAQNPGEVTLLCLGPLTNVALALRMDPNFCRNVKEIFIMGGNMEGVGNITGAAEFNFYCDPEAAFITIHNMKCPITIFPWEAAFKYGRLSYDWRKNVLGGMGTPQSQLMNKVERVMLDQELYGIWARCDPLAAAILLTPEVATELAQVYVTVELHGANTRGAMVVDHLQKLQLKPNVTLIKNVDKELYKKLLVEAFSADMVPSSGWVGGDTI